MTSRILQGGGTDEQEEQVNFLKTTAEKIREEFEHLYFDVRLVFMSQLNNFSLYFIDYEFRTLKRLKSDDIEEQREKLVNNFQIERKRLSSKDIKLIEEVLLSLSEENQFLYSDDVKSPSKFLKCRFFGLDFMAFWMCCIVLWTRFC